MSLADPGFDRLIERQVSSALPMLETVNMQHVAGASALATSIAGELHIVLVEQAIIYEKDAIEFATSAIRQLSACLGRRMH